jgi:hypothetical protein
LYQLVFFWWLYFLCLWLSLLYVVLIKGLKMSRMSEQQMEQDERENRSGADDYEAWMASIEGSLVCPYCLTIHTEFRMCCGEMHLEPVSTFGNK